MRFDQFLKEACPPLDLQWRKYRRRAARHGVEGRMKELGLSDYAAYLERIRTDPAEAAGLAERMRITVSRFFREQERWETLQREVLPRIVQEKGAEEPTRIWSAGCCGGEEPYTLALLWLERYPLRPVQILATDIDACSLERARRGTYGPGSLREVPKAVLQGYFHRQNRHWRVDSRVRDLVRFVARDLMHPPPSRNMDLVCCRYLVFTYYEGKRRIEGARRLWQALRPGGALMIGRKEELGAASGLFDPWPGTEGVFRKRSLCL